MSIFINDNLIIPFLATVGAGLTIIIIQFFFRFIKESKQKIYTVGYICTTSFQQLSSEFILKRHTIQPHIEAVNKILKGDSQLLIKMFKSGEFDILRAGPMEYAHIPNDYIILIGYDDISLPILYQTLLYMNKNEENRISMVSFVEENLKSSYEFFSKPEAKQIDILKTYKEYLHCLEHDSNRIISFIRDAIVPSMKKYIESCRFYIFRTKITKTALTNISDILEKNKDLLPSNDHIKESIHGGIQNELKKTQNKADGSDS